MAGDQPEAGHAAQTTGSRETLRHSKVREDGFGLREALVCFSLILS